MRTGRPQPELTLTIEERHTLDQWTRRPKPAQALARRARFVLACATGTTTPAVAAAFRPTGQTVGRWRQRCVERRLAGVLDAPRPGAPRCTSDAEGERLLALETTPKAATHWRSRDMAKVCGLSQRTGSRIGPRPANSPRIRASSRRSGRSSACL